MSQFIPRKYIVREAGAQALRNAKKAEAEKAKVKDCKDVKGSDSATEDAEPAKESV